MKVAVIGGGAAGFFAAISCKSHHPQAIVSIYEKSSKTLSKVKISGGGRCNVTHACPSKVEFLRHYPRGAKQLKKTFSHFDRDDTVRWFESRGVAIKAEEDGRMFPVTNDSQTIIDCLRHEVEKNGIFVHTRAEITHLTHDQEGFVLDFQSSSSERVDYVIFATGGSPKEASYDHYRKLGLSIVRPVSSLFTFNVVGESMLKNMMGLSVPYATVKIQGTKMMHQGAVLITHWGLSGPAVLKLSAWSARQLAEMNYKFNVQINWSGDLNEEGIREKLRAITEQKSRKKVINAKLIELPTRLWEYMLDRVAIDKHVIWSEVSKKNKNRLVNALLNDEYAVSGKTTFKEEFVTCGGIDVSEVDFYTMQCRKVPGLFFAGEVLDIDGVTGGFNFQAAWSTGFVAGRLGQ